jgi:hypothetical protein
VRNVKDEEYLFHQTSREQKNIARSARNRRTHTGKSGRVKFPYDYMTKKELKAMNGEVKSYRLNEPMTWKEFKELPDDIKVTYIKLLREKWGVPDTHIAEMMGIGKCSISQEMTRLNLNGGRKARDYKWDTEGFRAWVHGVPVVEDEPVQAVKDDSSTAIPEAVIEEPVPESKSDAVNFEVAYKVVLDELEKANVEMELLRNELNRARAEMAWLHGYQAAVETIFQKED